jgi:NAD(P)-dependent dehydrogenase (short-subunit alcohol dehydrogenase family)
MRLLRGKTTVITGAGSGIGRSIAHALARAGMNVVVADIQIENAERVSTELAGFGVRSIAVATDVARHESVLELANKAYDVFGSVDVLVNNAGVSWRPLRTVMDATLADWKFLFDVNVWGLAHGLDAFLPLMANQPGEKHIVNTASLGGLLPVPGLAPFSGTKAAIIAISEAMAAELKPRGFGVMILCPGLVRTNIAATSEMQRAPEDRIENRTITPYNNSWWQNLYTTEIIDADVVGEMVRDAIQRNQLYLHTRPVTLEIADEHRNLMFGPETYGRATRNGSVAIPCATQFALSLRQAPEVHDVQRPSFRSLSDPAVRPVVPGLRPEPV